jgi:Cu(I)/Ag(I) efflux system membrane fusion protein
VSFANAQNAKPFNSKLDGPFTITKTFKVDGTCEMCKHTIEKELKRSTAIYYADWDASSMVLLVKYNKSKINTKQIEEMVAATGHNTPDVKADTAKMSDCCSHEKRIS